MKSLREDRLKILYVGPLGPNSTGYHRLMAMRRLGHDVVDFDTLPYLHQGGRIAANLRLRTLRGPTVDRLNADVLHTAMSVQPALIWFDKAMFVRRETVVKLRANYIFCVHQNDDNPFVAEAGLGWPLILDALPEYDLHLVPRRVSFDDYRNAGARDVFWFIPAYEPTLHYLPPEGWSDADRTIDVSFIGFPFDKRPRYLVELWQRYGIRTKIWGDSRWNRPWPRSCLSARARAELYQGSYLSHDQYRETIWRSRISLGFVNNLNRDEFSGRSFEIAASGGFFLAEDTPGHSDQYRNGEEAVFFNSIEECAQLILRYLPDEEARTRISRAGHDRAVSSGYSTDARVQQVLEYIAKK